MQGNWGLAKHTASILLASVTAACGGDRLTDVRNDTGIGTGGSDAGTGGSDAGDSCVEGPSILPTSFGGSIDHEARKSDAPTLGAGFNTPFGNILARCVSGRLDEQPKVEFDLEFTEVSTTRARSETLSVEVGASVAYAGFGAEARVKQAFAEEFRENDLNIVARGRCSNQS